MYNSVNKQACAISVPLSGVRNQHVEVTWRGMWNQTNNFSHTCLSASTQRQKDKSRTGCLIKRWLISKSYLNLSKNKQQKSC